MFWSNKRVLVAGGTGFLGRHVVDKLRETGCQNIFIFHRDEYDLTREEQVVRLFRDHPADVVIHLAGLVGGIAANKTWPAQFFYQNLLMGAQLMHYAWQTGAQKFVCTGSPCGYPQKAPLPLKEESLWDGFPQQESAPYSLAKRMLHVQSMAYWRQHHFPAIVTIPANIYGPFANFDPENGYVIPSLVRKFIDATDQSAKTVEVWGSGAPTRDFVYVGDVAEGILLASETYNNSELVNLASGHETTIREVVETVAEITGFGGEIVWNRSMPDGQARRWFDISKAQKDLGYRCKTNLREGLRLTVEWYRTHQASARKGIRVDSGQPSVGLRTASAQLDRGAGRDQ
jgi:GDP-L-fucose synthase